jgi:hypothetical protein
LPLKQRIYYITGLRDKVNSPCLPELAAAKKAAPPAEAATRVEKSA